MEILIKVAQLLTGLSLLVFVHELGHFLAAKAFGMKVNKFFIFFDFGDKKIFSRKIGETEYGIGVFPLGGYVQIAGMIDETQDASKLSGPPEPWEFRAKPAWQRFIVMIGGVTMNVIMGYFIFAHYLYYHEKEYLPISELNKEGIYAYPLAEEVGFKTGDKIVSINGNKAERAKELSSMRLVLGGAIQVERNGQIIDLTMPDDLFRRFREVKKGGFISPMRQDVYIEEVAGGSNAEKAGLQKDDQLTAINGQKIERYADFKNIVEANKNGQVQLNVHRKSGDVLIVANVDTAGIIGFLPRFDFPYEYKPYTLGSSFEYSLVDGNDAMLSQLTALRMMFTGRIKASETISSPIAIAQGYGGTWEWGRFWFLTGLISFALAVMNLLPIPGLDGGHIMFLILEAIMRRPPSEKLLERAQMVGMIIVLGLMVFAFGNDIYKAITGQL